MKPRPFAVAFLALLLLLTAASARADVVNEANIVGNLFNVTAAANGTRSGAINMLHTARTYTILGNSSSSVKFDLYESPDCVDGSGTEFPGGAAAAHWYQVSTITQSGDFSFKLATDAYCVALIARGNTTVTASLYSK